MREIIEGGLKFWSNKNEIYGATIYQNTDSIEIIGDNTRVEIVAGDAGLVDFAIYVSKIEGDEYTDEKTVFEKTFKTYSEFFKYLEENLLDEVKKYL